MKNRKHPLNLTQDSVRRQVRTPWWLVFSCLFCVFNFVVPDGLWSDVLLSVLLIAPQTVLMIMSLPAPKYYRLYRWLLFSRLATIPLIIRYTFRDYGLATTENLIVSVISITLGAFFIYLIRNRDTEIYLSNGKVDGERGLVSFLGPWKKTRTMKTAAAQVILLFVPLAVILLIKLGVPYPVFASINTPFIELVVGTQLGEIAWARKFEARFGQPLRIDYAEELGEAAAERVQCSDRSRRRKA